jgi:hypothetical protein
MTITVNTQSIQTTRPQKVTLLDHSGAHTELTLFIEGQAPIGAAFDYHEGEFNAPLNLKAGQYQCTFFVQAYHYSANQTLKPTYDVQCAINGQVCASAMGLFNPGSSDSGFNGFVLTVV